MCSTKQSNWVTFDDDGAPPPSPQKSLDLPGVITASVPCPNGVKLEFPPIKDTSWSFSSPQHSSQSRPRPRRQASAPCGSALSAALCRIPSSASSSHSNKSTFSKSFSSSGNCMSSSASESPNHSSDEPSPFPSFQGNLGHYNPFWEDSGNGADAGSSSSDSDTNNSLPRFFIRTKDGREPPRSPLQNSFSYVCNKLENLQAGADDKLEVTEERRISGRTEVLREGSSQFAPRGLFRSKNQDGWPIMLRIPEKKNRMSSRQWGPIYLRLLPGGVLQMYYEKGLEKPYKEFQLLPQCRLSDLRVESYSDPRKVLTVKVEHFSYTEKKRYHPKVEVSHEAEVEQLLKFGSTVHEDMEDLVVSMEEEIFKLGVPHQQSRHYEEQELSLQITDHIWIQLDKCGEVMERSAFTQIHCLAFLNGHGGCFLALNDLGLLRSDSSYGSEDSGELWMEIADCHLHKCVNEIEFKRSRLIKFSPPDACRVELMRYKTTALGCTDMPFSVKAVVTVQGAYVELQAFLNMSGPFLSSLRASGTYFPLCENVVIRVPVPGHWVRVTQTAGLLRQRSLKARMNRNACLGSVGAADSQPVMQVSIGSIKYESVYSAVVWRIDKLPAKNTAVDHPHSFCCRLELGSDQEIPNDWYPFVTMEAEIMGAVVSQTKVKSLGTANDIQPQKHVTSWTRYHCQAKLYLSIIDDVIDNMKELFLDEGIEDRVLDDLRHLWESKVMQSKAIEDHRRNNINSSNFVLQLPAGYQQTEQDLAGTLATFSLPASLAYPVQIPAGVTLQTASGQLYKVNVPVVVSQAQAGQQPASHPPPRVAEWGDAPALQPAVVPPHPIPPHVLEPPALPASSITHPRPSLPLCQESSLPQIDLTLGDNEPAPPPEPVNVSTTASPCTQLLDLQIRAEEALAQTTKSRDIYDILKEVIEKETEKVERSRDGAAGSSGGRSEAALQQDYSALSDIIQLDGPADNSDHEDEEVPVQENDFLGLINAEVIKALQEENESSDSNSVSGSSSGGVDELADVEEGDPLNSGDDVVEQDIPDLFDTDNVIVCQYDKIHRSKNRWKFHLKDGVICYGGRDYVFSKAVGEAEW
ncbi:Stonin-1 [Oryzias melastigma]|uniref:Stonin-1 n=1 Tax=Oryzias melastigma TaxID=30732 RepID=A0A834C113_ORYME|nr:Stonin-1 [Oryzias melastigma]